jgi:hypothetical protein
MARRSPLQAEEWSRELLSTTDVSELFVRGFRWLLHPSRQPLFEHSAHNHAAQTARLSDDYRKARTAFGALLQVPGSFVPGTTKLTSFVMERLRGSLTPELLWSGDEGIFRIVLALLDALDQDCGSYLRERFFETVDSSSSVAIHPDRAFPRPWPSFRNEPALNAAAEPPPYGLPLRYLRMERYFAHLAASPNATRGPVTSTLHVASDRGRRRSENGWKVAMLSILTAGDVEWSFSTGAFHGSRFADGASEKVSRRLAWALEECSREKVQVIMIPELNVDAGLRAMIAERLAAWPAAERPLVVAGGLHEPSGAGFRNRPYVWARGEELSWAYVKSEPVLLRGGADGVEHLEHLAAEPEQRMVSLDIALGRVAVVVCKDFLMDDVQRALIEIRANVVIVVAMTSGGSVSDFTATARGLAARSGAVTLFCNSSLHHRRPLCRDGDASRALGFAHPNTRTRLERIPMHSLDSEGTEAVVGLYTFCSNSKGLDGTVDPRFWRGTHQAEMHEAEMHQPAHQASVRRLATATSGSYSE